MTTFPTTIESAAVPAAGSSYATLTIDLDKIGENYRTLKRECFDGAVAAVVKADAYGLGMDKVAPVLAKAGARTFFVAQIEEGIRLRPLLDPVVPGCGIHVLNGLKIGAERGRKIRPDLKMGKIGAEREYEEYGLQPVLNSLAEIDAWKSFNRDRGSFLPAALHIDTGMNRLGLPSSELAVLTAEPQRLEGLIITLVMSHLACAERQDHPMNGRQLEAFNAATASLPRYLRSFANSSGIFLGLDYHFELPRPGVALYGVNPTPGRPNPMAQVVGLQAEILQIRQIDAPETVGYGAFHSVDGPSRIATVGVGYADGYLRSLSGKGTAWIGGQEVPVIGRISMDLMTIDVTGLREQAARPGAMVDLLAPRDGVDRLAAEAGTIGYEILTSLGGRYRRLYKNVTAA